MTARISVLAIALATCAFSTKARADVQPPGDAGAAALVEEWTTGGYTERAAATRALVAMDDRAVAALGVANTGKAPTVRGWAAETLEAMGRERADEQIRTRDDDVLADILRAFGEARDPDALGVLSSLLGSERARPREAARAALLAFGDGARSKLRQDYAELTGQPPPTTWTSEQTAHALFDAADRLRLRDVYALLGEGLARADGGDLAGAAIDFDAVLAQRTGETGGGDLGLRPEMPEAYFSYALAIEEHDPAAARSYLEKARRLNPGAERANAIAGELAFLDGRELEARGLASEEAYASALHLDGANAHARAALDRLTVAENDRKGKIRRWVAKGALTVGLVLGATLFVGRRRRRSRRQR